MNEQGLCVLLLARCQLSRSSFALWYLNQGVGKERSRRFWQQVTRVCARSRFSIVAAETGEFKKMKWTRTTRNKTGSDVRLAGFVVGYRRYSCKMGVQIP